MKSKNIRHFVLTMGAIVLLGIISSVSFFRIDLTAEKRYTLSNETKRILAQLDEPIYFDIYLDGDIPPEFRKFRNSIREMLDDFKPYAGNRLVYHFFDPSKGSAKEREFLYMKLDSAGLRPVSINLKSKDGSLSQQIVFPGAIVEYKGIQLAVNLLRNNPGRSAESNLNNSMETLEYELIKTVRSLSNDMVESIAFIEGHGELSEAETADLTFEFSNYFQVDRGEINGQLNVLDPYKAIIIAKPRQAFDEKDKFIIDRYIMSGGKVIWLIDAVQVNTDSLRTTGSAFALASDLNLEDQFFTYGVRINPVIVQDVVSEPIAVMTGNSQIVLAPWLYYPLVMPLHNHAITRSINPVWLQYANDIDTVGMNPEVKKSILLQTSPETRVLAAPLFIQLNEVERVLDQQQFNRPNRIVAVLLEGKFPSIFRSRNPKMLFPELQETQRDKSVETKMLVVADGDVARNEVRVTTRGVAPSYPLGYDKDTKQTFGNKEFLVNALNYLTDDAGLMKLRDREFQLRLLDKTKILGGIGKWQVINVVMPVMLIILGGIAYGQWRRYKYGKARV